MLDVSVALHSNTSVRFNNSMICAFEQGAVYDLFESLNIIKVDAEIGVGLLTF